MLTAIRDRLEEASTIIRYAALFFLVAALTVFSFYLAGNVRDFAEGTQLALLRAMLALSVILLILSGLSIVSAVGVSLLNGKRTHLRRMLVHALFCVVSLALSCVSGAILVLAGGNRV
jgi:hypothetical protein